MKNKLLFLLFSFNALNLSCEKIDITDISCTKFTNTSSNELLNTTEVVNIDGKEFKLDVGYQDLNSNPTIRSFPGNLFPKVISSCSNNVEGYIYTTQNYIPINMKEYTVEKVWIIHYGKSWETSKIAMNETDIGSTGSRLVFKILEPAPPKIDGADIVIKFNHNKKSYFIKSNI